MSRRNLTAIFTGLLLAACCGNAAAWNWSFPFSKPTLSPLYPQLAAIDTNGNLWVSGNAQSVDVVARYDGFGAVSSTAPRTGYLDYPISHFATGKDGSMLALGESCTVAKYDANGAYRWHKNVVGGCPGLPARDQLFSPAGDDGEHWLATDASAMRLGADGREIVSVNAENTFWRAMAADVRDGRLFATGVDSAGAVVTAYDRRGARLWQWHGAAEAVNDSLQVSVAADGSVRVAGMAGRNVFVAMIGADGATRWLKSPVPNATLTSSTRVYAPLVDGSGNTWLALEPDNGAIPAAIRLSATGDILTTRTLAELGQPAKAASRGQARIAPDGDLLLARHGMLSRIASDGTVHFTRTIEPGGQYEASMNIGGVDRTGAAIVISIAYDIADGLKMVRIARNGDALTPPATQARVEPRTDLMRTLLPDGSQAVWTSTPDGTRELLRIGASGNAVWRTVTPGTWSPTIQGAVATNGDRICVLDARPTGADDAEQLLACHRGTDGTLAWSRLLQSIDLKVVESTAQLHVDDDGSVSAWYSSSAGGTAKVGFMRLDRDGSIVTVKDLGSGVLNHGRLTFNGRYALVRLLGSGGRIVFDHTGAERYRPALPSSAVGNDIAFDRDGGMVVTNSDRFVDVMRIDSRGTTVWTRRTEPGRSVERAAAIGADAVYVPVCCSGNDFNKSYAVVRLALGDGREVWRREIALPERGFVTPRLTLTPAGDAVVALGSTLEKVQIDVVDTADGHVRAQHQESCNGTCAATVALIDAQSRVHVHQVGLEATPSAVAAWQIPARDARLIRLDQTGIAGAWWSPYANGEGFVLDYLADSRTLFMPWFTFSRAGGNDPAGQRWYVVQGAVPANATSVELPITESTGGAFDAGPSVTPTIVGTATLSFSDCDNGTLRYRFDEGHNGAATGTITLSRLSPATQNCILADGSTQTRTVAPANGFDARMSGSWFEPATSGQGMQLTVQPGGIFFAPWFTFDPVGASDDPGKQRWFTIQGSIAGARNGVATLPIVQTIGGTFDSVPTNNMYAVGSATITMLACDRAKVDYRYDDNELAAAMRNRSGSIDLVKAGGCMR